MGFSLGDSAKGLGFAALGRMLPFARGADTRLALLADAFAADADGRAVTGPDGLLLVHNPAWSAMVGNLPLADRFAGDRDMVEAIRRIERQAQAGTTGQDRLCWSDGTERRWFDLRCTALPSLPGALCWSARDVTAQVEMLQALREEHDRLAEFVDSAPVGFYAADAEGRFLFANSTLADWLGRSLADLMAGSLRVSDVIAGAPPADLLVPQPTVEPRNAELKLRDAGGAERPVHITWNASDAGGGRIRTRSVVGDLTHELKWRDTFRLVEEHFHRFFDLAPIGIMTLDTEGRVVEANGALRRAAGRVEVAGRKLVDLLASGDRADLADRLTAVRQGSSPAIEVRFKGPPERLGQLFVSRLDEGFPGGAAFLIHFLDTTDQKALELQFAQSQKMQAVGQLAGGVAHDFNNLLTAIIGYCDLLLLRHAPGEESFADVMQIKQNANRAANLVRQLLAFSRQQTLRPVVLDLTDVLADLRQLLARLIGENIELKMLHGRDVGPVKVDQGQFEQVVINLAVNARDAMIGGGTLTIRTAHVSHEESIRLGHELMPPGEYVLIEVADTGKGIPKEIIGKIFEPFFTTKEVGAGTGLGLSTVYGIVKQTGGFVFPESLPGHGAVFRIYLPRYRPEQGEKPAPAEDGDPKRRDLTGKGTVLLVEDEDAVRTFAARALRNKGYTVLEANSGESALALMGDSVTAIDLLVSDVVMPNMDGPTLVEHVRVKRPNVKIIFISGYAEDAFRKRMENPGDIHFLPKPFSLSQLAGKVKEVLRDGT